MRAAPDLPACAKHGCKDTVRLVVDRDGKAYCRPHAIAEAERRPRSGVRAYRTSVADIGGCPNCGSVGYRVQLDTGDELFVSTSAEREPRAGRVAINPGTGGGHVVGSNELPDARRWAEAGVTFHQPHAETCPHRRTT